jgi:hypothetical protein
MTETQFKDLTRKAMIREYLQLHNNTITIVDAANALIGYVEQHFDPDDTMIDLYSKFDKAVDNTRL